MISLKPLVSWVSGDTVKPLKSLIPLLPLGVRGAENCAFPFQKLRSKGRAGPYGRPVVGWGRKKSTHPPKGDYMTTNDYFDQEMRVMTPYKVLQPRAFALC